MAQTVDQTERARIGEAMHIVNRPVEDSDVQWFCSRNPDDWYCRELQNRPPPTQRDYIARSLGIATSDLTDAQAMAYCEAHRSDGFDLATGYCHYLLNRDAYDRTSIGLQQTGLPVEPTQDQINAFCANYPDAGYCTRHPTTQPESRVQTAAQPASSKVKTVAIVGSAALATGLLAWWLLKK